MKKSFLLACLVLSFISCSNEDDVTPEPEESFYALRVGNSWVYEHYRRDNTNSDQFSDTGVIDSVEIVSTEIIDGNEFYKYRIRTSGNETNVAFCAPNGERFEYLRDSLGYLINSDGKVQFSRGDDQEFRLNNDTSFYLYTSSGEGNEMIATTAGNFDCEYMKVYARPDPTQDPYPGLDKYYYAEGIGKVFNTVSFSSRPTHTMERRLVSYNVQ